jgi:hypothetical protein
MKTVAKQKNKQIFRFCISCTMVSLIQKGKCYFCGGDFILFLPTDDLHKMPKRVEKTH